MKIAETGKPGRHKGAREPRTAIYLGEDPDENDDEILDGGGLCFPRNGGCTRDSQCCGMRNRPYGRHSDPCASATRQLLHGRGQDLHVHKFFLQRGPFWTHKRQSWNSRARFDRRPEYEPWYSVQCCV